MAKIQIVLKTWQPLKDGSLPIVLRIEKDKTHIIFRTGLSCPPQEKPTTKKPNPPTYWNDVTGLFVEKKIINPDYEANNVVLTKIKSDAVRIISDFERLKIDWTIKMFSEAFKKKTISLNPSEYFENHIKKLSDAGRFGNADVFRSAHKILQLFDKKFNTLKFPDIDVNYIEKFDTFLRVNRNLKDTSISVYMRTFATLINAAIADGLMQPGAYPFKTKQNHGYKISKLNVETKKRFIPVEYLQKLENYKFDDHRLETARNLFLFSFYCRGMNWIDMAYLTDENIKKKMSNDGKEIKVLEFIRTKTHKPFEIIINSDIQLLLNWFKKAPHCKPYLLPIVTVPEHQGEALRVHIRDRRAKYNNALNDITAVKELKFPDALKNITSYFSRHSYSMVLRSKGVNIELISEALGHAELKTTAIYLDSFGKEEVANASENLLK